MPDTSYTAAAQFVRMVRNFAQSQPAWGACVIYETKPDERLNLPLVSFRVYGNFDEALTILAAAGLDSMEQAMSERRLVLPTKAQLKAMKTKCGLVTSAFSRTPEQAADPVNTR